MRFLRYPGGKGRKSVREQIFRFLPKDYKTFVEPMVGGGIFWYVDCQYKIIADIDDDLLSVYYALKNRPDDFIRKVEKIEPYKKTKKDKGRIKEIFENFKDPTLTHDKALRYLFINRTCFGGRVRYDIPSRLYMSNPEGWNKSLPRNLKSAAKILKNVTVKNVSYSVVIHTYDPTSVIYLDPPYYCNSNFAETSKLYRHNFSVQDHEQLADELKKCRNKWILSYDDCPEIRTLFSSFNLNEAQWKYSGTSSCDGHSKDKKSGKELIITNF